MIDVEDTLRAELDRLVEIDPRRDWGEVVTRAGVKRARSRRWWALRAAAVAATAALLGTATPLGSAIARGLDDFSAWLTGEPGSPVTEQEQREFELANARSWLGFPQGTKLRRLITKDLGDTTVDLVGFRSGSTLCLRLTVAGQSRTSTLSCAPLAELRREGGPARVLLADQGIGKGEKTEWYGTNRVHSSNLQITIGIVSDAVTGVVLEDEAGRHEVATASNAFLYVAEQPDVGQRVKRVWARTATGLVRVPFAPTPFGFGGGALTRDVPPAPAVERPISGGRVGWLEDREPRGQPLDVLPPGTVRNVRPGRQMPAESNVLFGRVLAPDPDRPLRMVVTLNAHRPDGPPAGVCTWLVMSEHGAGGGCKPYPDVFEHTLMPTSGMLARGSDAFLTLSGIASDDVARLEALLADGQRAAVPLKDNAFLVDLPRARLPARLVAYDSDGQVIAVSEPWDDFGGGPGPAKGRATSLLRVSGPDGSRAELLVGPATDGGECMYVKHVVDARSAGMSLSCGKRTWGGRPLQLSSQFQPPRFIGGRVREDVKAVRIRFADGTSATLTPTRGYVLWAASAERLDPKSAAVAAEGLDESREVVGRVSFAPPKK